MLGHFDLAFLLNMNSDRVSIFTFILVLRVRTMEVVPKLTCQDSVFPLNMSVGCAYTHFLTLPYKCPLWRLRQTTRKTLTQAMLKLLYLVKSSFQDTHVPRKLVQKR